MQIEQIRPDELTPDLTARWEALRRGDEALATPFLASEMARRLGAVCDGLRIAVVSDGTGPVAFVPVHHGENRTGALMGWPLMDCQGLIAHRDLELDLPAVMRGLGLARLRFMAVPKAQRWFEPYVLGTEPSMMIRVERFRNISRDLRKLRKLEHEVGPIQFTASSTCRGDLQQLITWKRSQIDRTRFHRLFDIPWIEPLLCGLPGAKGEGFHGVLSTLHAGNQLVAAHLGVRSDTLWHIWFPAFDPAFSRYSPGLMLLRLMVRAASELGVPWVDFGGGPEAFKYNLANDSTIRVRGAVTTNPLATGVTRGYRATIHILRRTGLDGPAKRVRGALRRIGGR